MMYREASPPARESRLFRHSRRARAIFVALAGMPAGMLTAGVFGFRDDRIALLVFSAVALLALLRTALFVLWPTWRVDDAGIERLMPVPRLAGVAFAWADIVGIQYGAFGSLLLRARNGRRVFIPPGLVGQSELVRIVLERATSATVTDLTRRTLGFRYDLGEPEQSVPIDAPEPVAAQNDAAARLRDNPFFVLGLPAECSQAEVERTGQKLLALLAIESRAATTYATPLGPSPRTPEKVRAAMGELRDPERRLAHEAWAHLSVEDAAASDPADEATAPWPEAMAAAGWRAK